MTSVSTCVDCATPIIGDRARCPSCHALHAPGDEDVTVPRPRQDDQDRGEHGDLMPAYLVRWIMAVEVIAIVGLALILAARGCA